jgi:hypothetical protein
MFKFHEIVGFMPPDLAKDILDFAFTSEKDLYRAAATTVAEARKLRPVFFMRKPRAERDPEILAHLSRPQAELAAGELLRGWLVKSQADMLTDFLDALGIAHQGGVTDDIPESVDDEKLSAAIEKPLERHPSMKVAVYLQAFHTMNEGAWPKLGETLDNDSRLQLG